MMSEHVGAVRANTWQTCGIKYEMVTVMVTVMVMVMVTVMATVVAILIYGR